MLADGTVANQPINSIRRTATHSHGIPLATWSATGALTLYVNGVQVAQNISASIAGHEANASRRFALGASTILNNSFTHVFTGQVAELRLNNTLSSAANVANITSTLHANYAVPEAGSAVVEIAFAAAALFRRRRVAGLVPSSISAAQVCPTTQFVGPINHH
jgi:hypothetical protein